MRIGLASPDQIRAWSYGEVKKPETINYRTLKPERDGLFCERIFGPTKDWECHCGKYKRIRYKGIICDKCGVEVTRSKVRRDRMGHIELAAPVSHIWYFKGIPSRMGLILDISPRSLEKVLYFANYIVLDPGDTPLVKKQLLSESEYVEARDKYGDEFEVGMGAAAIKQLLQEIDLQQLTDELRAEMKEVSGQRKVRAVRRLEVCEAFLKSGNRPEWMILDVVPVIPPELRPMVQLDGGRFATSDLNDLYRRVINRNNRLKRLLELHAPDIIVRNEKRMLQEAVDALIDNGRRGRPVTGPGNRPLKSLSDMLKGKQGRFRQNLLGKRVDYSGRSVIVVGPELKMHQCGLPKEMALELFKPFVMKRLVNSGEATNIKSAKRMVERANNVVWDVLEEVIKEHPVLLNRAPTLHRLGIQAFEPILSEGRAIKLHPLVCTAYNADFDGDQMAVHLPLSVEAQAEARMLMLSVNNILAPKDGKPVAVPTQDMVLGSYYLTIVKEGAKGEGRRFSSIDEAQLAYFHGVVDLQALIKVYIPNDHIIGEEKTEGVSLVTTTVGNTIFNSELPKEMRYYHKEVNADGQEEWHLGKLIDKKELGKLVAKAHKLYGNLRTAEILDIVKKMGYDNACKAGISIATSDIKIPAEKAAILDATEKEVDKTERLFRRGLMSPDERYRKVIDLWTEATDKVTEKLMATTMDKFNSVYMMANSGARGNVQQIRQLAGMRGLMADPSGRIIDRPIKANFREGLTILEYFISTHGARKGLADTALKTADAGYLTRRLVDVSHDVIVNEEDCGTLRGLVCTELKNNEEVIASLYERILGRVSVHDVIHPITGEVIVRSGEEIREDAAKAIQDSPIESVEIRSVLTCESKKGVCAKCYGRNLATNRMVQKGEVVGVIAAQSIGEPGTQLTLRTFHVGGIASNIATENSITSKYDGILEIDELRAVEAVDEVSGKKHLVVVSRLAEMRIVDPNTKIVLLTHNIPYGSKLFFNNGDSIKKGDVIIEWDPFNAVIVSEVSGKIEFESLVENVTYKVESDETTGLKEKIIIESKDKTKAPAAHIVDENGNYLKNYSLPLGAHVVKDNGDVVKAGEVLVKIPRAVGKAGDITGGLPRVTELFEARNPSNPAVVSEIDGEVGFGKIKRGNREITVTSKLGEVKKYMVPLSKQLLVQENDYIRAGMPLSDGATTPSDILAIKGPTAVQEYIVNEVQDVYRLQGVKINDKHFEVIVRQMMRKVEVVDPGDTRFLEQQIVDKLEVMDENDRIWGKKVVTDPGDSQTLQAGQIVTARKLRDENSMLKRRDLKLVEVRDAIPATANQILQGITRAALQTNSFMSAASFQETTKVLNEAAINGKVDRLEGLKENVICGHLIPAGTGQREFDKLIVGAKDEFDRIFANRKNVVDFNAMDKDDEE